MFGITAFVIWTIGLSILFAWLFNQTQGSIVVILFHAAVNLGAFIPAEVGSTGAASFLYATVTWIVALEVAARSGHENPGFTTPHGRAGTCVRYSIGLTRLARRCLDAAHAASRGRGRHGDADTATPLMRPMRITQPRPDRRPEMCITQAPANADIDEATASAAAGDPVLDVRPWRRAEPSVDDVQPAERGRRGRRHVDRAGCRLDLAREAGVAQGLADTQHRHQVVAVADDVSVRPLKSMPSPFVTR